MFRTIKLDFFLFLFFEPVQSPANNYKLKTHHSPHNKTYRLQNDKNKAQ